jgi:hypothetical protein
MFAESVALLVASPPTICGFSDSRAEVLRILNEKLAPRFQFEPCNDIERSIARFAVLLLAIPHEEQLSTQTQFRQLHAAVRQPDAPPVIAFLRSANRELIQQAVASGACGAGR